MIRRNGHPSVTQGAPPLAKPTPASPIVAVPVRVALLSDSALFRSGLHRLLGSDPSFLVVAELPAPPGTAGQFAPSQEKLKSFTRVIVQVDGSFRFGFTIVNLLICATCTPLYLVPSSS